MIRCGGCIHNNPLSKVAKYPHLFADTITKHMYSVANNKLQRYPPNFKGKVQGIYLINPSTLKLNHGTF